MTRFLFRNLDGADVAPQEWLRVWAARFPSKDYPGYGELIAKYKSFSATDFEQIGKWKDAANTEGKWKANVASVAYLVWMEVALEQPMCPEESAVAGFLEDWSTRKYNDDYTKGSKQKKFGLSRATTLLHFMSGGRFPIFDSRVRRAMKRLLNSRVPNSILWYLESYCQYFTELAVICSTEDLRFVDMALFSYGGRILPFPD